MSFLNKTLGFLVEELFSINSNNSLYFNCESANLTSKLLKDVNVIIVESLKKANTIINKSEQEELPLDPLALRQDYEYNEAIVYIVFILFWYSLFVVLLISTQTKKSELQYLEDSQNATKYLLRSTKGEHVKREVLELLKGPGYMQKMNEIYFDNPNQYKIKRFEIKRIKQIDKKLKQYYSSNQNDFYKTFDPSQLEDKARNKTKMDANLFLLKDLNKMDNNSNQHQNQHHHHQNHHHNALHKQQSEPGFSSSLASQSPKLSTSHTPEINRFKVEKINEMNEIQRMDIV